MQPQGRRLPLQDFKANIDTVFDQVHGSIQTLEVVDPSGRVAVVMDADVYQDKLLQLGLLEAILRGEQDLAAGRVIPHQQVMAEMDRLLE